MAACNMEANEAVEYNDRLVEMQGSLLQSVSKLEDSFGEYKAEDMDSSYRSFIATIQSQKGELEKLGHFEGDSTLYIATRELLQEYEDLATTEYAELISYMKIPDSLYTVQDQERSFALLDQVTERRKSVHEDFIQAQKEFGEQYGFTFIDTVEN
jgi:hypothetical protein